LRALTRERHCKISHSENLRELEFKKNRTPGETTTKGFE